ncbi:MAG: hypothetical protein E7440_00540 [Ruminococcaceae bacterium]|nr:hypothetical protein [Oscillospiraceae bacterium]
MQDVYVVAACRGLCEGAGHRPVQAEVNGGAIALGHPAGMTGARLIGTLCHELQRRPDAKYGLATLCVGGGFGSATVIEKV